VTGRWVTGAEHGDPAVRLFCFPHAGGGSRFFAPWRAHLEPHVQVCPIVLPGRESRGREAPLTRIGPLTSDLAAALRPYLDRPFAFFGHSLGALIAYETVRAMIGQGLPQPAVLMASGRRAPHLTPRESALHLLPTPDFLAHMEALGGTPVHTDRRRRLLELFLPMLRADYELNETYEPGPDRRPSCPVVGYHGRQDPVATPAQVGAWRDATSGPFRLRLFDGDHFYHKDAPAEVMAAIRDDLTIATPFTHIPWEARSGTSPVHLGVGHGGPPGQDR
jgi:surfactin synthase thioesterase subunit